MALLPRTRAGSHKVCVVALALSRFTWHAPWSWDQRKDDTAKFGRRWLLFPMAIRMQCLPILCHIFPLLCPSTKHVRPVPPRVRPPFVRYTKALTVLHSRFDTSPPSYTPACSTPLLFLSPSCPATTTTSPPPTAPVPPPVALSSPFSIAPIHSTTIISIVALGLWLVSTRATLA